MGKLHEDLLAEWEKSKLHDQQAFIRDGIIDPNRWRYAPRKLLFILREAYGEEGTTETWDLRELVRDSWKGPKYKSWWTMAYWAYLVQYGSSTSIPRFPKDDSELNFASEAILSSAVINIKKSRGRSFSSQEDLAEYVDSDGAFIRRQVEAIAPDIVICGGVWSLIADLWPEREEVYDAVWTASARRYIDFWHPANRMPNRLNYYALAAVLQSSGALVP